MSDDHDGDDRSGAGFEGFRCRFSPDRKSTPEPRMPSKKKPSSQQSNASEIVRGGKAVPKELVSRCIADLQQRRIRESEQRIATERRMSKYLGEVQGAIRGDTNDPRASQSLDGLLGIHQKLA